MTEAKSGVTSAGNSRRPGKFTVFEPSLPSDNSESIRFRCSSDVLEVEVGPIYFYNGVTVRLIAT